jgi:hypothetical protein
MWQTLWGKWEAERLNYGLFDPFFALAQMQQGTIRVLAPSHLVVEPPITVPGTVPGCVGSVSALGFHGARKLRDILVRALGIYHEHEGYLADRRCQLKRFTYVNGRAFRGYHCVEDAES